MSTEGLISDADYFTTLAFVKLADNGERNFAFARKPGADIGLKAEEIRKVSSAKAVFFSRLFVVN